MAAAHRTLDEVHARELAAALTWEKENTIACHLEQHLTVSQGMVIPLDNNDDRSVNAGCNPNATLVAHLHVQATDL
jgi:hypothetical protein